MFKVETVEDLAEDAFNKAERVRIMGMSNTPTGYEERKNAFVEMAKARDAAIQAEQRLLAFLNVGQS